MSCTRVAAPALDDPRWLNQRRTVMTGNAINAKSKALEPRELSSEELVAVSGGSVLSFLGGFMASLTGGGQQGGEGGGGQNDPAQMFQRILQSLT
jgi:hypothetical protein